jgi:hypothetical protein
MATEQTPRELASRDARRRQREFNSLMWLCGWGGVTAVALLVFAMPVRLTLPVNACGASSPPVSRPHPTRDSARV